MKKIIKNTSLYTIGAIIPQAANLFLLPVYTNYLPPKEYGIYTSMMMFSAILVIFFTLAFDRSLNRLYFDYKSEKQKKELLGTASILVFLTSTIVLFILLIMQDFVGILFKSIPIKPFFILAFFIAYNSTFLLIPLIFFRITFQAKKYITLSISQFIVNAGLSLIFIIILDKKAEGLLLSQVITGALFIPLFFIVFTKNFKFSFKKKYIKPIANFSLPMVPALLAAWVINLSDRVFIEQYFSTADVGIYALGYQIAQVTAILSGALFQAYNPLYYETAAKGEHSMSKLKEYNHVIVTLILFIAFSIALFSKELISIIFSENYKEAYHITIIISLAYFISSGSGLLNLAIYQKKKTLTMMFFVLFSAVLNINLNFIFIPKYGMFGAAFTTVITFIIFFIMKYFFAKKHFFIPFKHKKLLPLITYAVCTVWFTEVYSFNINFVEIFVKFSFFSFFLFIIYKLNKSDFIKLYKANKQKS